MYNEGKSQEEFWDASPVAITRDILSRFQSVGLWFWVVVIVTGVLFALGIIGFFLRLQGGFQDRGAWGYYAATFAFLFTVVQGAPMVTIGLLFTKAHLRRPIARPSGLFAVPGILVFLLFIPILSLIPPVEGRGSLWMGMPIGGAPYTWDILSVGFLVLCGLAFFWLVSRPDLDVVRRLGRGWRAGLAGFLAGGWVGAHGQWWALKKWMVVLGTLYFVALVMTNTLISSDVAMSLVPGWRSAIFAPYHVLTALQGGVAATIVAMGILRWTGFRSYLLFDAFWALGKIMFALSLLGIYFTWADFITLWYGRTPREQIILQLTMFGPIMPVFVTGFVLSFFGPLLAMMWNRIRQSILGPTIVAIGVLAGLFLDRIRLYVVAFSASQVGMESIETVPSVRWPDGADWMMMIGFPAGAILLYVLASKVVPAISVWQIKELLLLRQTRRYVRARVVTIAKPE